MDGFKIDIGQPEYRKTWKPATSQLESVFLTCLSNVFLRIQAANMLK